MGIFGGLFGGEEKQFETPGGAKVIIIGREEKEQGGEYIKVIVVDTKYGRLLSKEHGGTGAELLLKREYIMASDKEIDKQLKRVEK